MALWKAIGKTCLAMLRLQTFLTETGAIIKWRALVYLGEDLNDRTALTPSHFLSPKTKTGTPLIINDDNIADPTYFPVKFSSKETLFSTWKKGQNLLEVFWKLWGDDYLLSLWERSQINLKLPRAEAKEIPSKGDIVQIKANVPRGSWKTGKIIELLPNSEGIVRAVKVLLATKIIVNRPLNLLYPIECESTVNDTTEEIKQLSNRNAQSQEKLDKSAKFIYLFIYLFI